MPARVLVTNVEERAALAACRALASAAYTVVGAASMTSAAGLWSRSCSETLVIPDPRLDEAGFADGLEGAVQSHRIDIVLPAIDAAVAAVAGCRERIERHARLGLPPDDAVRRSLDRLELVRAADEAGLPAPRSVICDTSEAAAEAGRGLGFPYLVKPRTAVVGAHGRRRQQPALVISDADELDAALAAVGLPCLLQRFEPRASVFSCGGVTANGRLLGLALSRYRRTWRPAAGSAAYAETVDPPGWLEQKVLAFVEHLGWEGMFELELVGRDGPRHAIDFNPRPYGSMGLATSAGVNLPALWCGWLLGREPAPVALSQAGFRYRWEEAEARHFAWQLTHGRPLAAAAVLVPRRRTTHAFFRLTDPLPAVAETLRVPRRLLSRIRSTAPAPAALDGRLGSTEAQ